MFETRNRDVLAAGDTKDYNYPVKHVVETL